MNEQLLYIMLDVVTPVAVCAAVGVCWAKMKQPFDTQMVTRLVSNVGVPCLVFSTLVGVELDMNIFFDMALAGFLSTTAFLLVGWRILKLAGMPIRTNLNPIVFANTGNMGLPLCLLAFGDQGLALGIAYFVVNVILLVTVGIAIASAEFKPLDILRRPFIYAVIAAALFLTSDVEVPKVMLNTTELLGNFTIPLMLITLGVSLATLQINNIRRSIVIVASRFGLGIPVGFGLASILGFEGAAYGTLVVMCSMPVAVITFLFAENYGADGRAVASSVVLSTLISFIMLPGLIWFLSH